MRRTFVINTKNGRRSVDISTLTGARRRFFWDAKGYSLTESAYGSEDTIDRCLKKACKAAEKADAKRYKQKAQEPQQLQRIADAEYELASYAVGAEDGVVAC